MSLRKQNLCLGILAMTLISSCRKHAITGAEPLSEADVGLRDAVELVVSAANGVADDEAVAGYSVQPPVLAPVPVASCTVRASSQACVAERRQATYSACDIGSVSLNGGSSVNASLPLKMSGWVRLDFTETDLSLLCDLAIGESVTRTQDLTFLGVRDGSLRVTSENRVDYRGQSYADGVKLRRGGGSLELTIFGISRILTGASLQTLSDLSLRTLTPVTLGPNLARGFRTMNGGSFELSHQGLRMLDMVVPNAVAWEKADCCFPTSGSLSMTLSGKLTGNAVVSFTGCGTATIQRDGQFRNLVFSSCE